MTSSFSRRPHDVSSEEVRSHTGEAIRQAGDEVVAEGSRAMGPYLFFRDPMATSLNCLSIAVGDPDLFPFQPRGVNV